MTKLSCLLIMVRIMSPLDRAHSINSAQKVNIECI
jgi:hypothetical protein